MFNQDVSDLRRLYIGETQDLPNRIHQYLNPGPSQKTNQRIKDVFRQDLESGRKVVLDVLAFDPFCLEDVAITQQDLSTKMVRHFLEGLFGTWYLKSGYHVLNASPPP